MNDGIKDFEVEVRIRNNLIKHRRRELGMSQAEIAAMIGVSQAAYSALECMRISPKTISGDWRKIAKDIAGFFMVELDELFPNHVLAVERNIATRLVNAEELAQITGYAELEQRYLPPVDEMLDSSAASDMVDALLDCLTDREAEVIRLRFGIGGDEHTNAEAARALGLSKSRVQQLELNALAKFRHPSKSRTLRPFVSSPEEALECDIKRRIKGNEQSR